MRSKNVTWRVRWLECEAKSTKFFLQNVKCVVGEKQKTIKKKKKDDSAQWYLRTWVKFSWINSLKKLVGGRYMYITELFPLPGILREKRLIKEKK